MALIIFKIREINKDILPLIASNTEFLSKEYDVANNLIDYDNFTDLEKLVFNFKKIWGYYYDIPLNGLPRPHKDDFEALFSTSSTYEDYVSYYSSLENFYQICYKTKSLSYYSSNDKIEYLLKILSPSALAVIPYNLIIKCIKQYLKINLSQEDQRVLVKLVISINPSHANHFLDFLLEKENGAETNFQVIYDTLTDARLERYSFVNWFVEEQTNRKYFAFAIYELWKISKYNLDYIRAGIVIPNPWPNFKGVDPENYFIVNPQEFNKKNFLTFTPSSTQQIISYHQRFESSINDKKIDIKKIYNQNTYTGYYSQPKTGSEDFGSFHLYQQISFCGYESNLDLRIPTSATLPAFLFHFIEEYDRLADFDAGVALALNLTVDTLLIYFTGGTSILSDLQYLKHTTKIGRALAGGIEATEAVEIWQGFKGAADIFTITAGSLTQINHYLITTENNEDKRKILEGCQKIFISLTFLGVGLSVAAQAHAVSEAGKVLDLIEALPSGVAHGLAPEMINLLKTLKGNKDVTLSLFGNKLNNLDLGDTTNYILIKYNSVFTDAQRLKFMKDFQHIDDLAFWRLLNNGRNASGIRDGSFIDNWIILSEKGLEEAKFTQYICNQRRTDALIRYVDEPILKPIINTLSFERKLVFIDTFGDELAKFSSKPELIDYWKKYYDDLSIRNDFQLVDLNKKIRLLEKYGSSTEALKNIRYNAKEHIQHLLKFDEPLHDISYFYKRRGEMLPPSFKDIGGDGKIYGIQEVDTFIELELKFGGTARPSAINQAGDIVMDSGLLSGKSLDPLGISHEAVHAWSKNGITSVEYWFEGFKNSIKKHFEKITNPKNGKPPLDKVVIDYKYMDQISIEVGLNPSYLKNKIDDFLNADNFPYKDYVNENYLIKINY